MSLRNNYFKLLNYDLDTEDETNTEVEVDKNNVNSKLTSDKKSHLKKRTRHKKYSKIEVDKNNVNLEFLNPKSTSNKKSHLKKRTRYRKNSKVKIYDEMSNLPSSLDDAKKFKQNLTLKQILVLMNLHAIPGMVINQIHDIIQEQVHKMNIKIFHDGRVFFVSQYHWYDLNKIEMLIDAIFNT